MSSCRELIPETLIGCGVILVSVDEVIVPFWTFCHCWRSQGLIGTLIKYAVT